MLWVVAPLLHKYEEPVLAVKVTEPPEQMLVEPPAVMVAVELDVMVTATGKEVAEQDPLYTVTE